MNSDPTRPEAPIPIAVDAMSGDHGHEVAVDAALSCLAAQTRLQLTLVGDEAALNATLAARAPAADVRARLHVHHASEVVGMEESPAKALRSKKDSSMRVAVNLVKAGTARAAVSAGNTGALMATAKFVLKTLPGIDRPAILAAIPAANGHTHVLDLGANAECTAEQLFQFAVMGSVLANVVHGLERPRVGLLNIGSEEIKGNEAVRQAAALIAATDINYQGFIEGDGIFLGDCDVVVCDGFTGNVALKTTEGAARLIRNFMREEFERNWLTKAAGLASLLVLKALGKRLDPRQYNGASFVGLNGIVIKSHGGADVVAFANAIKVAALEAEKDVPNRIAQMLAHELDVRAEQGEVPPAA